MGTDSQILAAYRQGLTPEQIAEDLDFPVYAVKAKLMNLSADYRKACGNEPETQDELNLSREEQTAIKRKLMDTFLSSEDEHVIVKLGTYLRDDGKGRKDVIKQVGNVGNFNILQLVNTSLAEAKNGARQLKQALSTDV